MQAGSVESSGDGYSPWGHVGRLADVLVAFDLLPSGRGWWDPEQRVILIDKRLTRVERRCTLAHELEHLVREDGDELPPLLAARQEHRAHASAARRLIELDRLVDALLWARDEHELADELDVDVVTLQYRLAGLDPVEHAYIDQRLWAAEEGIA